MIETDKKLILLHLKADSREEVIRTLCELLEQEGYIGSAYCGEVLAREREYPTGLPSEGAVTAIPHALSNDVRKTGVAVGVLESPVTFYNISDYEEELQVEVVFVLANGADSEEHLDMLQELMDCMSRPKLLEAVKNAAAPEQVAEILRNADSYPEE